MHADRSCDGTLVFLGAVPDIVTRSSPAYDRLLYPPASDCPGSPASCRGDPYVVELLNTPTCSRHERNKANVNSRWCIRMSLGS
ncbi:hypothetical protein SRHO_G00017690 [Serrasalmus rhombeus]